MNYFVGKKVKVKNENKTEICEGVITGIENGIFVGVEFEDKVFNADTGKMEIQKKEIFYPASGSFCFEFVKEKKLKNKNHKKEN